MKQAKQAVAAKPDDKDAAEALVEANRVSTELDAARAQLEKSCQEKAVKRLLRK